MIAGIRCFFCILICGTMGCAPSFTGRHTEVGPAAISAHLLAPVKLLSRAGKRVGLPLQLRRPTCLHLWATWCPPCRGELPELDAVAQSYAGTVDTYLIAVSDHPARVRSFVEGRGIKSPVLLDSEGALPQVLDSSALPATICTDSEGYLLELRDPQAPHLEQRILTGPRNWRSDAGRAVFDSVAAIQSGRN